MKNFKSIIPFCLVIFLITVVTGCTGKTLVQEDRQKISSISIDVNDVSYPDDKSLIMLNTYADGWAMFLGGFVGQAIYEELSDKSPKEVVLHYLRKDQMLKNTVAEAFKFQFEKANVFPVSEKNKADAYLIIEIPSLQFHQITDKNLRFTGNYKASLLSSTDGRILWSSNVYFSGFNSDLIRYPLEEFLVESEKLKYALSVLSQMNAAEFIKKLGGKPVPLNHALHAVNGS